MRCESRAKLPVPLGAALWASSTMRMSKSRRPGRAVVGHGLAEHAQRVLALQVVHGGDEAREVGPGVGVEAALAAQALDEGAVDDAEVEAELVPHLVAPLDLQGGRADHQDAVGAVAEHQFQDDHAGLRWSCRGRRRRR